MGFGWFFWPNAPLYVQLPTLLPNGRQLQSLGSIQGTWPFPHLPSHLLSERGRTLYKPGLKCNIQWLLGAIVLSPGGETEIEMTRWTSLACCTGCPSLPGSHTFLRSSFWPWVKCVHWESRRLGQTIYRTQASNLSINLFHPTSLKWPPSFCRDASGDGDFSSCNSSFSLVRALTESLSLH